MTTTGATALTAVGRYVPRAERSQKEPSGEAIRIVCRCCSGSSRAVDSVSDTTRTTYVGSASSEVAGPSSMLMRSSNHAATRGADELVEIGGSPVALNDSRQTTFAALHRDEFASSLRLLWI